MLFLLSLPLLLVPWLLYWIWRDPRAAVRQARLLSEGFIPGGFIPGAGLPRGDLRKTLEWRGKEVQLSVGAARCHISSSHAAGTPVNSADITGITSAWGSYDAPLDAGNRSDASSSRELSFPDIQYQQGADDFCAYYGLASALLIRHESVLCRQLPPEPSPEPSTLGPAVGESSAGLAEDCSGAGPPAPRVASPAGQRRGCSTSILLQRVSPARRAGDGPGTDAPRAGNSPGADVSRAATPVGRVHAARFLSISSRVERGGRAWSPGSDVRHRHSRSPGSDVRHRHSRARITWRAWLVSSYCPPRHHPLVAPPLPNAGKRRRGRSSWVPCASRK